MSSPHTIIVLATEDIASSVKQGLMLLATPMRLPMVVDHQVREITKTVYGKLRSNPLGERGPIDIIERRIEPVIKTMEMAFPHMNDVSDSDVYNVVSMLINEHLNALSSFLPTYDPIPEIAALINEVDLNEVTENHLTVANHFTALPIVDSAFVAINSILSDVSKRPWRDWSLFRQGDVFLLVGGKDHRIEEWEQMTGHTEDSEQTEIDIKPLRSYLLEHFPRNYCDLRGQALKDVVDASITMALAFELRDQRVIRKPKDADLAKEYAIPHAQCTKPVIRILCEQSLRRLLPKALSTYNTVELVGNSLVVSAVRSEAKYQTERQRVQAEMENQDYIPERLRRHYQL